MIIIRQIESPLQENAIPNASSSTPSILGAKFAKRLNSFLLTCSNLEYMIDRNTAAAPDMHGPSLQSPTVDRLAIGIPSLVVQGKTPLGTAFPNLQYLKLAEKSISMVSSPKRIAGEYGVGVLEDAYVEKYVEAVFGDPEKLRGVRDLFLEVISPNEDFEGQWKAMEKDQVMLHDIVGRFKGLKRLEIMMDPPYTHDPAMAFMIVSNFKVFRYGRLCRLTGYALKFLAAFGQAVGTSTTAFNGARHLL